MEGKLTLGWPQLALAVVTFDFSHIAAECYKIKTSPNPVHPGQNKTVITKPPGIYQLESRMQL